MFVINVSLTTDYFRHVLPTSVHIRNQKNDLVRGDGITQFRLSGFHIAIAVLRVCSFYGGLFNDIVS
jgi:hypothetical protein